MEAAFSFEMFASNLTTRRHIKELRNLHDQWGLDSVVGIATSYGLGGPWLDSWWGVEFSLLHVGPDRPSGPPSLLYNGYRVSFLGVGWPERGVNHKLSPSADAGDKYRSTSTPPMGLHGRLR